MMRPSAELPVVYICCEPVDFRKGLQALAVLVESQLQTRSFLEHNFMCFETANVSGVKISILGAQWFLLMAQEAGAGAFSLAESCEGGGD